ARSYRPADRTARRHRPPGARTSDGSRQEGSERTDPFHRARGNRPNARGRARAGRHRGTSRRVRLGRTDMRMMRLGAILGGFATVLMAGTVLADSSDFLVFRQIGWWRGKAEVSSGASKGEGPTP